MPEFVRLGGPKVDDGGPVEMAEEAVVEEIEILRFGFGGDFIWLFFAVVEDSAVIVLTEPVELDLCDSEGLSVVVVLLAQCCDNIDLDSSIGVKILLDLTLNLLTGSSICA